MPFDPVPEVREERQQSRNLPDCEGTEAIHLHSGSSEASAQHEVLTQKF